MDQQTKQNKTKDGRFVYYNGNLDKYFKEISECAITTREQRILKDMYKEIKKIKEKLGIE